jgi:hypothetical protein
MGAEEKKRGRKGDQWGHATLSPMPREVKSRWALHLVTCSSAESFLSYQERDSTSVSGGAAGGHGPCGLRLLCSSSWGLPLLLMELVKYNHGSSLAVL